MTLFPTWSFYDPIGVMERPAGVEKSWGEGGFFSGCEFWIKYFVVYDCFLHSYWFLFRNRASNSVWLKIKRDIVNTIRSHSVYYSEKKKYKIVYITFILLKKCFIIINFYNIKPVHLLLIIIFVCLYILSNYIIKKYK